MSLIDLVVLYLICAAVFFAIDLVWLLTATPRIYKPLLGDLLADNPKLGVAAGFYLLYVVGVIALAVLPGVEEGQVGGALWRGALLGCLAYATYDLTNLSTIRGWPWRISVIDIAWGTALTSVVAVAGYYAAVWLGM